MRGVRGKRTEDQRFNGIDKEDIEFRTVEKREFLSGRGQGVDQEWLEVVFEVLKVFFQLVDKGED